MLVVATSTPARLLPGAAAGVARELDLTCGVVDMNGACAGFVYAWQAAQGFLAAGLGSVLVVGSDILSQVTDPDDRATVILFGDGAGAVLLSPEGDGAVLGFHAGTDPGAEDILYCEHGGHMTMEGPAVFKLAVRAATDSALRALERAGLGPGDVDLFVPHQANQRITDAIAGRLELGPERVVSTIARTGNTSAGSIPHALSVASAEGRLRRGDVVLLSGFGAGMTWATAVLRWA
jgi:3-oxoacyl-[acyl-carrier-protein] synthase-3